MIEWDKFYFNSGNKNPQLKQTMNQHIESFYKWSKRDDGAIMEGIIHDLDKKIESLVNVSK